MTNRAVSAEENVPSPYLQYKRQRDIHYLLNTDILNTASHQILAFSFHDVFSLSFKNFPSLPSSQERQYIVVISSINLKPTARVQNLPLRVPGWLSP